MRKIALLACLFGLMNTLGAQSALNFWKAIPESAVALPEQARRTVEPMRYQVYQLNYTALAAALRQAPMEYTEAAHRHPLMVQIPTADGALRTFRVWESPIMAPELTERYPEIRTYAGEAVDDPSVRVRLGVGYLGFHAFIRDESGRIQSVRTYADGQRDYYVVYHQRDLPAEPMLQGGIPCGVADDEHSAEEWERILENGQRGVQSRSNNPAPVKTYRTAIAAKGEYSQFHGGTKASVLNAINIALNYIVNIQEPDFGVRLVLIPNNDAIIFLDPNTDPYSGETVGDWMNQNPGAINPIIGIDSYDIGHVFARYITGNQAGVAGGRACSSFGKARGASSASNTSTEYFYRVAAHELGHQMSASHTWSNCPGAEQQLAQSTAFEPGSGSTIMSYAGACGSSNVQGDADSYFHLASIIQVRNFVTQDEGATCGGEVNVNNQRPTVSVVSPRNVVIPVQTPFRLMAQGSDPDGDALRYNWEQFDTGPSSPLGAPTGTAPMFRSFPPTANTTRFLPRMQIVANNTTSITEVIPIYNRPFTFRVSVRDNRGAQAWDEIRFSVNDAAGPFRVDYPNANGIVWRQGEDQVIVWDVANTDRAPINCQRVNIRMSTDGGLTYPITLATDVPNKGRHCIRVPNIVSTQVRIMVEAADNLFFDISNANLRIEAPTQPAFSLCAPTVYDTVCLPAAHSSVITTRAIGGFSTPITLSALNLPAGATAKFTPNPVMPGQDAVMEIAFPANQPEGTFEVTIRAEAGTQTATFNKSVAVFFNDFTGLALQLPPNGADGQNRAPSLRWKGSPNANTYEVQLATNPSFEPSTIVSTRDGITVDTFQVPLLLEKGTVYYWRMRPINECGRGAWVGPFAFATLVDVCAKFEAFDLPKNIPTSVSTIESKINVQANAIISDVNVSKIRGNHQFFRDLEMSLISPVGTKVLLFRQRCGGINVPFTFGFDDSSPTAFACPPGNIGTIYRPEGMLNAFNGQSALGTWTLEVKDNFVSSGGTLSEFEIELCSGSSLTPPVLVKKLPLILDIGTNAPVTEALLKTEDANNNSDQIRYTLVSQPKYGRLELNWTGEMAVGAQFTQTQINNGALRYFHYGANVLPDQFCFTVTDGEGGLIYDCLPIQIRPVGTRDLPVLEFMLTPNPATDEVRLFFGEALRSDTRVRLFDASGRLVRERVWGAGQSMLTLSVVGLPGGFYTLSVENAEGVGVRKVSVR
ncbi:MAG: cadherin-like domain-containing protein [Saprospiraceae bacterium]|nr:M12 family metallo-peptidase [Saprospiraceae bacterium]MDW8229358.1 cadherin-like domain-containing protein [Saprospiraceae bacterium]